MARLVLKYPAQSRPAREGIWGIAGSAFRRLGLLVLQWSSCGTGAKALVHRAVLVTAVVVVLNTLKNYSLNV